MSNDELINQRDKCAFAFDESETNFKICCGQALKIDYVFMFYMILSWVMYQIPLQLSNITFYSEFSSVYVSCLTSDFQYFLSNAAINFDIMLCNHYNSPMCQITQYTRTIYSRVIITPLDHMSCPDNLLLDYHNN